MDMFVAREGRRALLSWLPVLLALALPLPAAEPREASGGCATGGAAKRAESHEDTASQQTSAGPTSEGSREAAEVAPPAGDLEDFAGSAGNGPSSFDEYYNQGPVERRRDAEGLVARQRLRQPSNTGPDLEPPEGSPDEVALLPGRQRVHVRTFGCPHNASDGEYLCGQLASYGYVLVESVEECDVVVVNSCTVKHPSETRALNNVEKAQQLGKHVVLTGCVPSSDRKLAENIEGVSVLDVSQIDRIVDVVEETVKGHTVKLLEKRSALPSLELPKVRRSRYSEIITINAGCLGNCTYCKTKLARGKVVSHPIETIVGRALQVAKEGVCAIELASEDMGAYGVDIGVDIVQLLLRLSDALLEAAPGVMLRTGMTNPPFILYHVEGMVEALNRPNVHAFMHIPVQSGSDKVLSAMRREYTVAEFSHLADRLKAGVPDLFLLTDVICGFPAESEEDWQHTMALARKYRFHGLHLSQFYARPGTPAARLKPLKSHVGKDRYREMTEFLHTYNRNEGLPGRVERVWFSGTEEDHGQTVGRTKSFAKVVVPRDDGLLGRSATVRIGAANRLHVEGEVLGDVR